MTLHEVQRSMEDKVARALEASNRRKYRLLAAEEDVTSPFSPKIQAVMLPPKFKLPQITAYDGKSDPRGHLRTHVNSLLGRGATKEIQSLLFPGPLKWLVADWFYSLELGSITSFASPKEWFLECSQASSKSKEPPWNSSACTMV